MTPSDRVRLISEIGRRLGAENWALIDVTLGQFNLPRSDDWHQNDRPGYVMTMIQEADNEVLLQLGKHVGYEFGSLQSKFESTLWRGDYFRLFVSHLAEHRKCAHKIRDKLLAFRVSSFVAHDDIEPTQEWQEVIEEALATCDGMLVLLHPGFHESEWTDQEIGYAMGRRLLIVAAGFGMDPYGFIGRFQAMEGKHKTASQLAEDLFEIFRLHQQTRKQISEAIVRCFEQSGSYPCAIRNMDLLEMLDHWDSSLSDRARSASKSNPQISKAWWVPERLEKLINSRSSQQNTG